MANQSIIIQGAVGDLELVVDRPEEQARLVVVVCHPHPLFQGTMHNKVAYMLAQSLKPEGAIGVRFNFRGVGDSEGEHADGIGEVDDVLAVLGWVQAKWPELPVVLAGFSFGAYVALLTAQNTATLQTFNIQKLVTVAPPVGRWDFSAISAPQIPWLVIQGDEDELVEVDKVRIFITAQTPSPTLEVINSADHFFHGKLNQLRELIQAWFKN
ncbi:MAG: alpha/beta fold hydrolase [Gammaproteobacteria bacterium]|nr:alpha/beta fold hydrolase [Gammaproteobacteria bacterium]NNC97883.1 alpha/beta fold hydrolase [Gammaproteobacteria bacterium]NNM13548.1 alpha/beta fold hydrolase [Gammaproteobacteria bacterium]